MSYYDNDYTDEMYAICILGRVQNILKIPQTRSI